MTGEGRTRRAVAIVVATAVVFGGGVVVGRLTADDAAPASALRFLPVEIDSAFVVQAQGDVVASSSPPPCLGLRCLAGTGVVTRHVTNTTLGLAVPADEVAWVGVQEAGTPAAVLSTDLTTADVTSCGSGVMIMVSWPNGDGTRSVRWVPTRRDDALGRLTGEGTMHETDANARITQGQLVCDRKGAPTATPAITGTGSLSVEFSVPTGTASRAWRFDPACRPTSPQQCLRTSQWTGTASGTATGEVIGVDTAVLDGATPFGGTVTAALVDGSVTGCGTGSMLIGRWPTGPTTSEWIVIPHSGRGQLANIAGGGSAQTTAGGTRYRGSVVCPPTR
jgi:hypothetical protein